MVNQVVGKSKRHEDTLAKLIQCGIASETKPYSKRGRDGLWEFTGFAQNVVFGPGSDSNAIYHCEKCNTVWEWQSGDYKDNCVFCTHSPKSCFILFKKG
jgi:hypothetical protein